MVVTGRIGGLAVLLAAGALSMGCSRQPSVSADGLPLRRVVVYRNGVGYFERAGHVSDTEVTFRVRGTEVGDFLATLAVMESGGSSVRSAAFPIEVPPSNAPASEALEPGTKPVPQKKPEPSRLRKVVLSLDGQEHDLKVGYVVATPVWRPSYRLVVASAGADLQAWGIVQNLSGEDWRRVRLTLVAGAPLAFEASLGTPVTPDRPKVTDTGEVLAVVPQTEVSLGQDQSVQAASAPEQPQAAEDEITAADYDNKKADAAEADTRGHRRSAGSKGGEALGTGSGYGAGRAGDAAAPKRPPRSRPAPSTPAGMPPPPPPTTSPGPSGPRNLSQLAAVAVESGVTRFDIPQPISVPDKSATMVMLLSQRVPGELAYLYAPDPGVPSSIAHPFRVARFTNRTGATLERGPLAIFEAGAFLGQGMIDQLPVGAATTVPFALERSLAVELDRKWSEEGARIAKIEAGELLVERDSVLRTLYKVRNGSAQPARVLVKHGRQAGFRLHEPPKDTEDNVGTASALVPTQVAARTTRELVVDERRANTQRVDWTSQLADEAVKAYLRDARADRVIVAQLQAAWQTRETLVRAIQERQKLSDEQQELRQSSDDTRRNLRAIEKIAAAADLRHKLTQRLTEMSSRLDEITKRLIEVDIVINEQRVRFLEAIRLIKLLNPPSTSP